ncbi:hypothetical protein EIP91_011232 [Steccherinum ochraceum]|uniref:Uncharacterized protein n=1 Tax=Steccherinum ochraceum TaxID=92696 RepID=A0A4R0RL34_9APHY|nr:hypothetical protein EIP91_011232 [Steccherinum ochraceum]
MSSRLPRGTVAAIAVCASVAITALLVALAVYLHRRRSTNQRKQNFIQNPRMNRFRRFSWMSRTNRSLHGDAEKDGHEYVQEVPRHSDVGVLDITQKSAEDMEDEEITTEGRDINAGNVRREGRVASQNSDGSFSIELPKQPERVRSSLSAEAPSPTPPPPLRDSGSPIVLRTSRPRGPRDMRGSWGEHARQSSRGILLSDIGTNDAEEAGPLPRLGLVQQSPFRVNFQDVPQEVSPTRTSEEQHVSTGMSIPHSLKVALFGHDPESEPSVNSAVTPNTFGMAANPDTPRVLPEAHAAAAADPHLSFLDMESSGGTSIKSSAHSKRQSNTDSTTGSSRPDYGSVDYALLPPLNRKSLALSMNIGGGPTSSRPSLSPSISLQPIPLPPLPSHRPEITIPEDAFTSSSNARSHIASPSEGPSPTDSLPATVSDIHFRHSSYSTVSQRSESRRVSAINRSSGSHRLPHPPLPTSASENRPFIVQKLLGMHGGPPSASTTPFASPITPGFSAPGPSTPLRALPSPASPAFTPTSPAFFRPSTRDSSGRTK